jgi:hypothetical protein
MEKFSDGFQDLRHADIQGRQLQLSVIHHYDHPVLSNYEIPVLFTSLIHSRIANQIEITFIFVFGR